MKTFLKFSCIYCGQHMECDPRLSGRQILCPACLHRIVIPTGQGGKPPIQSALVRNTWDTRVPLPLIEIPTRYRNRMTTNAPLPQPA